MKTYEEILKAAKALDEQYTTVIEEIDEEGDKYIKIISADKGASAEYYDAINEFIDNLFDVCDNYYYGLRELYYFKDFYVMIVYESEYD